MSTIAHQFIKPGQVAPDLPPPDQCVRCGLAEAAHQSATLPWADTVREAFRNAVAYQHEHQGPDSADQGGLYSAAARTLGLDLGTGLDGPHGIVLDRDQVRGVLAALDTAAEHKRDRAETCPDCDGRPDSGDLCGACTSRLAVAGEWDALAETLRTRLYGGAR